MKILFIGNSFSQDAVKYIKQISKGELYVRNLHISGCSIAMHAKNIEEDAAAYEYQADDKCIAKTGIKAALLCEEWDVVSIQQASYQSGLFESYEPYIVTVLNEIKKLRPNARIVFHRTWPYNYSSTHSSYPTYNCDTDYMNGMIAAAAAKVREKYCLDIIPSGDAVYRGYNTPEFDVRRGGTDLTRDTFHLSLDYGRYLASLVLYRFFTGKSATRVTFFPDGCDEKLVKKLQEIADSVF